MAMVGSGRYDVHGMHKVSWLMIQTYGLKHVLTCVYMYALHFLTLVGMFTRFVKWFRRLTHGPLACVLQPCFHTVE